MPTFLCHGFRWHRISIRHFVIIQDIEDGAPEWVVAPRSSSALLDRFYELYDFIPPSTPPRNPRGRAGHNHSFSSNSQNHHSYASSFDKSIDSREGDDDRSGRDSTRKTSLSRTSRSMSRSQKAEAEAQTPPRPLPPPPPPPSTFSTQSREREPSFNGWSAVKLLEEYDPSNETLLNGPWAYVADYVVKVDTSVSIMEEMMQYEERMKSETVRPMSGPSDETGRKPSTAGSKKAGWFEKLRDQLQGDEGIRWYIVVCGDEERSDGDDEDARRSPSLQGSIANPYVEDELQFRLPELLGLPPRELRIERIRPRTQEPIPVIVDDVANVPAVPQFSDYEVRPLSLRPSKLKLDKAKPELPPAEVPAPELPPTEVPKPEKPKMEMPEVDVSKPEKPKMEVPRLEKPRMEKPRGERPKGERPIPERRPRGERPLPESPKVDRSGPRPERPVPERPVPERPVPERPIPERPALDRPIADRPIADRPILDRPIPDRPIPDRPMPDRPKPGRPKTERTAPDITIAEKPSIWLKPDKARYERPTERSGLDITRPERPPAVPAKDYHFTPAPPPLQNLQEKVQASGDTTIRLKSPTRVSGSLRKFFSKRNLQESS